MKCTYPNCQAQASWIPVIEIPTIRTAGDSLELVKTDRPTMLIGKELCQKHAKKYNFLEYFGAEDWRRVQEEARSRGYRLDARLLTISMRPLGWRPDARYLEIER